MKGPQGDTFRASAVQHVLNPGDLPELHAELQEASAVVFDLETTGLNEYAPTARVVTASFTLPVLDEDGEETAYPTTWVVALSHPDSPLHTRWREVLRGLALTIQSADVPIIGQNIRFDVRWVTATTGVDLHAQIAGDTGLTSHLLDENRSAGLKQRACETFGLDAAVWRDFDFGQLAREQVKDPAYPDCPLLAERVDYFTMALYNARDTYWTWRLWQLHSDGLGIGSTAAAEALHDEGPEGVEALRLGRYARLVGAEAVRTITDMEQTGMALDRGWCEARLASLAGDKIDALSALSAMLDDARAAGYGAAHAATLDDGTPSYEPTALWFKAWADTMAEAGHLTVLAMTPQGQPSWSKEVLGRLARGGSAAAAMLLTYRRAVKAEQFLRSWLDLAGPDGRIHSTYHYYRVVTGRLSSSDPNMQQVSRDLKPAFVAGPGRVLVEADYSQIELRVAAHIAGCEPMIQAYRDGADLHTVMAAQVSGVPIEAVTPEQRQAAKAANFGFLYGMQAHKFVTYADDTYGVKFTHEEAEEMRLAFFETWKGLADWHARSAAEVVRTGQVSTPLGRIRRLPTVWGTDYDQGAAVRQAINSPVQSMASDLMLLAAAKIRRTPGLRPVALVHDAIVVEAPEARGREAALQVKAAMESVDQDLLRLGVRLSVPLQADVKFGRAWGSGEKV